MCDHEDLVMIFPNPKAYHNSNIKTIELRCECKHCGQPGRFIGVAAGQHLMAPHVSLDQEVISIPAVIGFEDVHYERPRLS